MSEDQAPYGPPPPRHLRLVKPKKEHRLTPEQEKILKQILRTALQKQGTALSWNSFAKDAEIKSHRTVSSYIEDLENMYVLFIQYFIDLNRKIPDYSKNKKILQNSAFLLFFAVKYRNLHFFYV